MAIVPSIQSNSPQTCKFLVNSSAPPEGAVIANATLLGFMFGNGPLRALWSRTYGTALLARQALQTGVQASIYSQPINATAAPLSVLVDIDGGGLPTLSVFAAGGGDVLVELRHIHTENR